MSMTLVRRLLRFFKSRKGIGNSLFNALNKAHGHAEAGDDPRFGGAAAIRNVVGEGQEQHPVNDPQLGNEVTGYRDYLMRIGRQNVVLADANGWLALFCHQFLPEQTVTMPRGMAGVEP